MLQPAPEREQAAQPVRLDSLPGATSEQPEHSPPAKAAQQTAESEQAESTTSPVFDKQTDSPDRPADEATADEAEAAPGPTAQQRADDARPSEEAASSSLPDAKNEEERESVAKPEASRPLPSPAKRPSADALRNGSAAAEVARKSGDQQLLSTSLLARHIPAANSAAQVRQWFNQFGEVTAVMLICGQGNEDEVQALVTFSSQPPDETSALKAGDVELHE